MNKDRVSNLRLMERDDPETEREVHLYYPIEGFGNVYRRVITNDFFTDLIRRSNIHSVAELPLDSYGVVGAGSLIFTQLGCEVSVISDEPAILDRARALMDFNGISNVNFMHSPLYNLPVPDNAFDFTWSFDRLQTLSDPNGFLKELCRVSKSTLVSVPNVYTWGQYPHFVYHKLTRTTCDYVGPRKWLQRAPIRKDLRRNGMIIVRDGLIDVPWWPGFPEISNIVRRMLGRKTVNFEDLGTPEVNPEYVPSEDLAELRKKVQRAGFVELGRWWPEPVKVLFAHNVYVIGCKPQFREELGL